MWVQVIISEGGGELGVTVLDEEAVRAGGVATFPLLPRAYPYATHQWILATLPQLRSAQPEGPSICTVSQCRMYKQEEKINFEQRRHF